MFYTKLKQIFQNSPHLGACLAHHLSSAPSPTQLPQRMVSPLLSNARGIQRIYLDIISQLLEQGQSAEACKFLYLLSFDDPMLNDEGAIGGGQPPLGPGC